MNDSKNWFIINIFFYVYFNNFERIVELLFLVSKKKTRSEFLARTVFKVQ